MARLARAVFPGIPHHVTQRGNGRQQTFFSDRDCLSRARIGSLPLLRFGDQEAGNRPAGAGKPLNFR